MYSDENLVPFWCLYLYNTGCRGLFEMMVGILTNCHLVLQMQPHVISFYGVTSRIRFIFLLFPQVSQNWRYESEPPLKPSPPTCYRQFGTNSIIVLMFVESQRVHIWSTCKVIIIIRNTKDWTLWSIPSPELQMLAPTLLWSSNCSPSLWSVMVWFLKDSVLWHSLQVWKSVPSVKYVTKTIWQVVNYSFLGNSPASEF